RATGEGHISSITFRSGVIDDQNQIRLDPPTRFVTQPETVPNSRYEKTLFVRKLVELNLANGFADGVFALLGESFTLPELEQALEQVRRQNRPRHREFDPVAQGIIALAKSNYEIEYTPEQNISERIIFPSSPTEVNGIEDARFVRFEDDNAQVHYYATYSAF